MSSSGGWTRTAPPAAAPAGAAPVAASPAASTETNPPSHARTPPPALRGHDAH